MILDSIWNRVPFIYIQAFFRLAKTKAFRSVSWSWRCSPVLCKQRKRARFSEEEASGRTTKKASIDLKRRWRGHSGDLCSSLGIFLYREKVLFLARALGSALHSFCNLYGTEARDWTAGGVGVGRDDERKREIERERSESEEKGRRDDGREEDEEEMGVEGGCYRRISERTLALWMEVG